MIKVKQETQDQISELQNIIKTTHTPVEITKALTWLGEEVEELKQGINNQDQENIKEELAQVLIWCFSIANILNINIAEIVEPEINHHLEKYPLK